MNDTVRLNTAEPQTENPLQFIVTGMDCATCARTVETGVARLEGVQECAINYTAGSLRVTGSAREEEIIERVRALGYDAHLAANAPASPAERLSFWSYLLSTTATRLTLLGLLLILPGLLFDELLPVAGIHMAHPIFGWMALGALAVAGLPIVRSAWRALVINRQITINLLMTIAAVGAVIIGAWTEAGLVMVLFALGEALEGYSMGKVRGSIRALLEDAPNQALVLRPCMDCRAHMGQDGYSGGPCPFCGVEEQVAPVASLRVGEQVLFRPGDQFSIDGKVIEGHSEVNQAYITGESMPVPKQPGDEVFAGSINGSGALVVEVMQIAADSTLARIVRMVEDAMERRAPVQRTVDRFAAIYTPVVVIGALLVATLPPLVWGAPFWGEQGWLYRALALLVVACPCALVLSTPVSVVSAISRLSRSGTLVKGGEALQTLARITTIAFDKTGTLTHGAPVVLQTQALGCLTSADEQCALCDEMVALAHAVERRSEHPLARAVQSHAVLAGVADHYPAAANVTALPGWGVRGEVNGRPVMVGSHAWFERTIPHPPHLCATLDEATRRGATPLLVSVDDAYAGYMLVADAVRAESVEAVRALRALGIDDLVMVTGDNAGAAQHIANAAGFTRVLAEVLPAQKVDAVQTLKQQAPARVVAMVGDGVNDAPALAAADIGIAMGGGSAQAMETAAVVLLGDDLRLLPGAIQVARRAMRTIHANIWLSVLAKLAVFALVLVGLGSMWLAVVADVGLSLVVTLNGMRLLRAKTPHLG